MLWPPVGDTFRAYVAREAATVTLQLLGITAVGAFVSALVREARERRDFASRLRDAYGKAKGRRRRLRRLPAAHRNAELELLDDAQLEFENLRDEAEWTYGNSSKVITDLTRIEKYLHDVVDAGFSGGPVPGTNRDDFQDFVAPYSKRSRFATDFKNAYHSIRQRLR